MLAPSFQNPLKPLRLLKSSALNALSIYVYYQATDHFPREKLCLSNCFPLMLPQTSDPPAQNNADLTDNARNEREQKEPYDLQLTKISPR